MSELSLSQAVLENLTGHLIELEKGKDKLLEQYFPEPTKERDHFEQLIDKYIKQVNQLISSARKTETMDHNLPFVTIGSEVEVRELSRQQVYKYRIVTPFCCEVRRGDVSYLSPVGKALLLKQVGDEVEVNAPGGVFRYRIESIRMPIDDK